MLFFKRSKAMVNRNHVDRGGNCRAPPEAKHEERIRAISSDRHRK